jgi:mono/diheme cytochrome c family protein
MSMKRKTASWRPFFTAGGFLTLALAALLLHSMGTQVYAGSFFTYWCSRLGQYGKSGGCSEQLGGDLQLTGEPGGTWYWQRSPEEEKRVIAGLYNRYCIRCHAVDGRGVWDIPGVPDFTNARWQACRSDAQLARAILEGRGAVMPSFRGTLTLEEAWAMARYLRTFVPGTEVARPDVGQPEKPVAPAQLPAPKKPEEPSK